MSARNGTRPGKTVLITGGGTGIGRAAALLYARRGVSVIVMGRRQDPLTRVCERIRKLGGRALAVPGDITREESVRGAVQLALREFETIDVLVNSAGLAGAAHLVHEVTDPMWQEMIDCNLSGAFRMARAVLPHFMDRRRGVIVNVSSIAGLVGMRQMAGYSAAKSGMIALTRSIATEYGRLGIRCNCVCAGTVDTPMTQWYLGDPGRFQRTCSSNALRRVGRPSEIARAIYYLGSDRSSFLTGAILVADGGYTAL